MEITKINNLTPTQKNLIKGPKEAQSFSNAFDMAKREDSEQQLSQMLKNIERIGKRLQVSKSIEDVKEYKKQIEEYLSFIIANFYTLRRDYSITRGQIYTRVEVINKKIEELTSVLLQQQKDSIDIIARVDEIAGLLLDIYQ